jgi:ATP-binding cassette subfamily F protein 3
MDIISKETLEKKLKDYTGTLLFVSHDRYFIKQIATSVFVFEDDDTKLYPYGYEYYMEQAAKKTIEQKPSVIKEKKEKKGYTTPAKEKARREAKIKKLEENLAECDEKIAKLKSEINSDEVVSDYLRLTELHKELVEQEALNLRYMEKWDMLMDE